MFKLVRIDSEEPSEIQLPSGTFLIGRDKLIGFDDKRLSYNQGLITVKEDSVTIESSQRKIYLTKNGSKEKEILNKTYKTTLEFGDKFGFLENCYWYELQSNEPIKGIHVNTSDSVSHFNKESVVPKSPIDDDNPRKRKIGEFEKHNKRSKRRRKEEYDEEVSDEQSSEECTSEESDKEEISRLQTERERCKYGQSCYYVRALRTNKAHMAKYSHPRDDDWGDVSTLKKCPQGANCRRQELKHFGKFRHPPGFKIYVRLDSDSDSESGQELQPRVLRTKRERKPPPKEDLEDRELEGSESEEDPFASDGSEDWTPEL